MNPRTSAYDGRGVIIIDSNDKFTASYGVTSGTGTAVDPYVIEGWSIAEQIPKDQTYTNIPIAVYITSTNAHLIIRNVEIIGGEETGEGIAILDACNIEIENVDISSGGIALYRCDNVKIHDSKLSNGEIDTFMCSDISVADNVIETEWWNAIYLDDSHDVAITGNTISDGEIYFENVTRAVVEDNVLKGEGAGLSATVFNSLVISRNTFTDRGLSLMAFSAADYESCTITTDNYVSGMPISVFRDQSDIVIQGGQYAQVILIDCSHVTVAGANFTGKPIPIVAVGTTDIQVSNTTFAESAYAAFFCDCSSVLIKNSVISSNSEDGVILWGVSRGVVTGNLFEKNGEFISSRGVPDPVQGWLSIPGGYGLVLGYSDNITVYHNDFYENKGHALAFNCTNISLDAGYNLGGNYWSGYASVDLMAGEGQNVPSPDGFWDRPYRLGWTDNEDRYPSMTPFRDLPPIEAARTPVQDNEPLGRLCAFLIVVAVVTVAGAIVVSRTNKRRPPE